MRDQRTPKDVYGEANTEDDFSLKFCDIWQNFYFYRILNNEKFKMEVEKTNFVTNLIITVQLYH